jgi:hypothetical protein
MLALIRLFQNCVEVLPAGSERLAVLDQAAAVALADAERSIPRPSDLERVRGPAAVRRRARRTHGKSDPLDAYSAARAALSGAPSVVPKLRNGRVEAIRALRAAPSSAVKARSQATNQIKSLIITGPRSASSCGTWPP